MKLIVFSLLIWFFLMSCNSHKKEAHDQKPNVVIFLADDQGWGDLSSSGNKNLVTPNIDAIAANGISFSHFYVSPVCSPTRAEFLTGRYHPRSGVYSTSAGGERLDLDETTLADVFKKAGYVTAAFGKWHNGMQYPYHPNGRGFDEFYGFCSGHWGNYFSPMLEHNGKIVQGEGYMPDDLTNKAMEFIETHKELPFLVYLPFNTPHSPMQVPDRWYEKYEGNPIEQSYHESDWEDPEFTKAALAMCENIDWNVGRVMQKLEALNLDEETIVLYFSDNGPNSFRWNGGMKGIKGSTDEGGVRSPLYMQWTGKVEKGITLEKIAGAIDLLPTLADFAGIDWDTRHPVDGKSFKPEIMEDKIAQDDRYLFQYWQERISVRSQEFRLDHRDSLYDMINDPGQTTPVNDQFPEVAADMIQARILWEEEVLSELPANDTRTFPVGHPDFKYTQLPARDAEFKGNIQRSNRWPNCSFLTNWRALYDTIVFPVEVLTDGEFKVTIYYTCPSEDVGSGFTIRFKDTVLSGKITEAHNPPLVGMEHDRIPREESYVKDFKPLEVGTIHLTKGKGNIILQANDIPGNQVMDFRLMMLERVD
ncbi:MAG: arylsulfatase [Bacteroidota bacterium]